MHYYNTYYNQSPHPTLTYIPNTKKSIRLYDSTKYVAVVLFQNLVLVVYCI